MTESNNLHPPDQTEERAGTAGSFDPDIVPLNDLISRAFHDPNLRGFGAPNPEYLDASGTGNSPLILLHLAAAYHRLAVVCDLVADYRRHAFLPDGEPRYAAGLWASGQDMEPYEIAKALYRRAVTIEPSFAEAHFGLARTVLKTGDKALALIHFAQVQGLAVDPNGPPHAHLHANAHWNRANILEDLGRDLEALEEYKKALILLDNFGVHHVRVAHFMRRLGLIQEAADNYQRCMNYSHRYFAEFALPPLCLTSDAVVSKPATPDSIYKTSLDEEVVFWQGRYLAVPRNLWPLDTVRIQELRLDRQAESKPAGMARHLPRALRALFGRLASRYGQKIRVGNSIAEFEPD